MKTGSRHGARSIVGLTLLVLALVQSENVDARDLKEQPFVADDVRSGKLPPISERIPEEPLLVDLEALGKAVGRYGGTLRTLIGKASDSRLLTVYGYARLVGYDESLQLQADILQSYTVEEGRIFTFKLRKGHRWSDGHPFTSEDFRYYWENVQTNNELAPGGITRELLVDGEPPKVEILDTHTVRYSWSRPHPTFLNELAAPNPLYIYRPAHFLKQFHVDYVDPAKLRTMANKAGRRNWVALHFSHDRPYQNNDPTRPTLQPWILKTEPPSQRLVFDRNPFFHRLDIRGHQLPYIDRVTMTVAGSGLIPVKVGTGDSDLQSDHLSLTNFPFLKRAEKRNQLVVHRWTPGKGAMMALYPNMNHKDAQWRTLFQNKTFRHALSLAIDRDEINQLIYFGLGLVGNNTVLPGSVLAKPTFRTKWAQHDPDLANEMLDDLGLTDRNSEGTRLLPDGRPMIIVVETAGENLEYVDILNLIGDYWREIGVEMLIKSTQREVFRRRVIVGETQIAVWSGLENAMPTPDWSPQELVPTDKNQLQWPQWGQHYETGGNAGDKPELGPVKQLLELYDRWKLASSAEERRTIWEDILDIHAEQQFTIGIVAAVPQVVVARSTLRNVPAQALYNWEPGSYFGIYRPDTFWFDK